MSPEHRHTAGCCCGADHSKGIEDGTSFAARREDKPDGRLEIRKYGF